MKLYFLSVARLRINIQQGVVMKRYFEFVGEDKSRKSEAAAKFWEVAVDESKLTVRFGKIGTNGQLKEKDLGSSEAANSEAEKLITEKTKKGYVEK
jgi:predicted DNA-binding WGR domain protein